LVVAIVLLGYGLTRNGPGAADPARPPVERS
jgi:hypothetical protein